MEGYKIVGYFVAIAGAVSYIIILCLGGSMSISISGRRMKIATRVPVKIKKTSTDLSINDISLALGIIIFQHRNKIEEIFIHKNLQKVNKIINTYNVIRTPGMSLPSKLPASIESELLSYLNENGQKLLSDAIMNLDKLSKSSPDKLKDGL
jgi:hypothetical protein